MSNNEIVPGFDNESQSEHLREYHDISLDHPKIELEKISEIKACVLIKLSGWLWGRSHKYFVERLYRILEAGYNRWIVDCEKLEKGPTQEPYLYYFSELILFGKPTVLIGLAAEDRKWLVDQYSFAIENKILDTMKFCDNFDEALIYIDSIDKREATEICIKEIPIIIECPVCKKKTRVRQTGIGRCPVCKSYLKIMKIA